MKDNQAAGNQRFRSRLRAFIEDRHPRLAGAHRLISTRSRQAAEVYREAVESGVGVPAASARADAVLYEGLIFSKFDTLRCILATEFPALPSPRQKMLALDLEDICKEVFARYNLDDGLVARSEYNHLIVELIAFVGNYFEQNEILFKRRGRTPHSK